MADVAQGVPSGPVPAVSRLISTPFRGGDISSKAGGGRGADAAGKSACATSHISTPFRGGDISSKAGVGRSADAAGKSACATSHKCRLIHFIGPSVIPAAEVGTLALALLS